MSPPTVVVVGDVINDVVVRPLEPVTLDSDTRSQIAARPGGSAANTACWLGHLGAEVVFVGRVGAEDHGYHRDHFAEFGVRAELVTDPRAPTGSIVIIVDDAGHRTMYTDRGANLNSAPTDVSDADLRSAGLLHLTAYSLFEPSVRESALEILSRAREFGVELSVDPSSVAFLREHGAETFFQWSAGARLIFPNWEEAEYLTGARDPVSAARALNEHYPIVVITLDAGGAVVAQNGAEPVRVAAKRITALDPTGAGDSFCAGFLAEWMTTGDIVAAAEAGSATAATAVTRLGARPAPSSLRHREATQIS